MSEEDKKPVKLVRMPDGSMRPATDTDSDIGNIWLTQKQIRAKEAEEEKQRKKLAKNQPKRKLFKKRAKQPNAAAPTVVKPTNSVPPASNYRVHSATKAPVKPTTTPATTKEIAISLTVPKLKLPKTPKKHAKKVAKAAKAAPKWVYGFAALAIVPIAIVGLAVVNGKNKPSADVQGQQVAAVPDYKTLTPNGDITDTTSQKLNYDPSKKVASFTDKIEGKEITVSMQPIPDSFKPAISDNVKKVAEGFTANTVLAVDNGAAYLGTSIKGPQSFVGYRGELLVFMMSQEKIADKSWSEYFNSLK